MGVTVLHANSHTPNPYAPRRDVEAFQGEMANAGADWQVTIYGNGRYGFTDRIADRMVELVPGVGYDARLDELSWSQATRFLDAAVRRS